RYGAFRPRADPPRLALFRLSGAAAELFRPRRAAARRSRNIAEPLLPPRPGLGLLPADNARLGGNGHRLTGGHLGRLLAGTPGGATRLSAADANPAHLRERDGPSLCAGG